MTRWLPFLFGLFCSGQSISLSLVPAVNSQGGTSALVFNSQGGPVVSLQWTMTLPPGVTLGAGAFTCVQGNCTIGNTSNNLTFPPGAFAAIPLVIAPTAPLGPATIGISNLIGFVAGGGTTPFPVPPFQLSITAPTSTLWFTATVGSTVCRVYKNNQVPVKLNWTCPSPSGTSNGNFTAGNGSAYFNIGTNTISPSGANLSCTIQVNGTEVQMKMLNGQDVDANSASIQCTGYTSIGANTISFP